MLSLIVVIVLVAAAFLVGMWFGMAISLPATTPKQRREITDAEKEQLFQEIRQKQEIRALKLYRQWTGVSLKEASDAIKNLKKELNS